MKSRNKELINLAQKQLPQRPKFEVDQETQDENDRLEAEWASIDATENERLWNINASKFDPKIYSLFPLGSNSSTLDISCGQWV